MKKKPPVLKQFDQISQQARDRIYALVMNHAKKHPDSPWSGKYLVDLEKSVKAFYKEMGEEYNEAFRDTLPDIMKSYYDAAVEEIKTAGLYKAIKGEPDPKRVKYFLESSFEQVAMKTDKMSFEHIKQLRTIAADVIREMSITGNTRREVSKAMLDRALNIKGFEFTDKSGAKWSNKSYFEMLARTELMNAARASYDDKMAEEGFDVVKLSVSGNSCDHCAKYEGELFSLTGATAGIPSKADLEADGVFHPNCTHSYSLVPPSLLPEEIVNANTGKNLHSLKRVFNSEPEDEIKKFDGNFINKTAKDFDSNLRKMPLSNSQIDEFNFNMQKSGHLLSSPPVVKIADSNGARTDIETGVIYIGKDFNSWDGNRNTISHEWGEMLFLNLNKSEKSRQALYQAIAADSANFEKNEQLNPSIGRLRLTNKQSRAIFNKAYDDLNAAEQHRIISFFDVAGSASMGSYGFGHTNYSEELHEDRFGNDAFANMYSAVVNNQLEFKQTYPNLWKFVEGYLK